MELARLGAMPSDLSSAKLFAGNNYTIKIRYSGLLQPSEDTVRNFIINPLNLGLFFENVTVSRPLFSQEFTINFRSKKNVDLNTLVRLININMPGYSVTDYSTGIQLAPTILERVAPVTEAISQPLSSVMWIALAGLGIYALFVFGPALKTILPKKG